MKRPVPGEGLLHPVALGAALLLALNDHALKALWPGTVTGKLSDFAGLVVFPLFLQALWELLRPRAAPSLRVLVVAAAATALVFALVKVWPPASDAYRVAFGALRWPLDALMSGTLPPLQRVRLTADATDLVALPAVLISIGCRTRPLSPRRGEGRGEGAVVVGGAEGGRLYAR